MGDTNSTTMRITSTPNKIHIEWEINVRYNDRKEGGFSCYIPGFEIYYSANTVEMMEKKAKTFTKFFFDHYLKDSKNQTIGFKRLMLDLNKKGYRDKRQSDIMYRSMKDLPFKAAMIGVAQDNIEDYESSRSLQAELEAAVQ